MKRGELWSYSPEGTLRQQIAVIVSSDGVNDSPRPWLLGAPVTPDDPQDILGIPVAGHGWVEVYGLSRFFRPWFRTCVGSINAQTQDQLDGALRAALDL